MTAKSLLGLGLSGVGITHTTASGYISEQPVKPMKVFLFKPYVSTDDSCQSQWDRGGAVSAICHRL